MFSAGGKPGGSAVAVRVGGRAILEEQITIRSRGFRFRHRQLVGGGEHLAFRSDRGGRDGDPARFDADHLAGSVDGGDEGSLDVHVTSVSESVVNVMFLNCSTVSVSGPKMDSDVAAGFFIT